MGLAGWSESENDISDRIVAGDSVSVSATANLMVTIFVGGGATWWAEVGGTVERDTEPIFQAAVEFLVLHVEAKHI